MPARRREILYCEMCGSPIEGRAYTITVEGVEMVVCERCYRRYMSRAAKAHTDVPLRLRVTSAPRRTGPAAEARPVEKPAKRAEKRPAQPARTRRKTSPSLGGIERYEVVEDYAQRIRKAREKLGLTQKELAMKVKVSEKVIKRIESGTLVPPIDLARRLERVLGVKLLEPIAEEYEEGGDRNEDLYLTLGDVAELRED